MFRSKTLIGSLVAVTLLSAFILTSATATADNEPYSETYTKSSLVRVNAACTMEGTEATAHAKTIPNGLYDDNIGVSVISAVCNDDGGFAVYAIGYTGEKDGENKLQHRTASNLQIATGIATSGDTSYWAMKLATTQGDPYAPTIENGYNNFSVVPDDYVKVASYPSSTAANSTVSFTTHYAAYISLTQPAGVYDGKVKYVMVHPANAAAPEKERDEDDDGDDSKTSFNEAYRDNNKTKDSTSGKYKLQDMNCTICDAVTRGEVGQLVDTRDNKVYNVGKTDNGRCWFLDNLALDIVDPTVVLTESNTNATTAAISNLKNGGGGGNGWSNEAVDYASGTSNYFDAPKISIAKINDVPLDSSDPLYNIVDEGGWKAGVYYNYCAASMSTYCFANNAGVDTGADTAIDVTNDVCPKGWRLPTGGATSSNITNGEFQRLYNSLSGSTSGTGTNTKYRNLRLALHIPLSGYFRGGSVRSFGSYFDSWSSTFSSGTSMYYLQSSKTTISPQGVGLRYDGASVRCISKTANE